MKQLVSILIPAFNAEKWICECIESALAQTWPWKEIIVVDDGSKDRTYEIAIEYSSPLVQVVKQRNRGACAARNYALSLAQGDYIQWMDADDLLAADKIEKQLEGAEPGQCSEILMSCSWGQFLVCPERTRFAPSSLWEDLESVEWLFRKIDRNEWMAPETWLVSRKLMEQAGPWNEQLARDQDGEYFCRVLAGAKQVRFFPEARVFKRAGNPSGISSDFNLTDQKLESIFISLQFHVRTLLAAENSERTRSACLKLINRWLIYFYPEKYDLVERLHLLATKLGGELETPMLPMKYRWIQQAFGWTEAKKTQARLRAIKAIAVRNWEQLLCWVISRTHDK